MAKRKRLSPAAAFEIPVLPDTSGVDVETKALNGWVGVRTRAPIADIAGDAAQQAAFEEVSAELQNARAQGRMVLLVPLASILADHLVRDRVATDDEDMATLMDSLQARGQQTPIEVVDLGGGQFGLISGWRRLLALQTLHAAIPSDTRFATVQALVRQPDSAADAYRAMIEENEIRADISFYERARIAVKSAEIGVYKTKQKAIQSLFSAARPAKRSKILAFAELVGAFDGHLKFPAAIPEKLGLRLVQALRSDEAFRRRLTESLRKAGPFETAEAERRVLERVLSGPPSKADKVGETLAPGLKLTGGATRLVLSGAGVDARLIDELKRWLRTRS